MKLREAVKTLVLGDARRFPFLDVASLRTLFPAEHPKTFQSGIRRLVDAGILQHVKRGLYMNVTAARLGAGGPGLMASALRPGAICYLSLESALAEWGSISQAPMRLTWMTTGRRGEFSTPWGTMEFTHTERDPLELLARTNRLPERHLRIAQPDLALEDLRRVRRNLHLVDEEEHRDIVTSYGEERSACNRCR